MMQLQVNGAEHKRSDAELAQLNSNGKAGMLAFEGALSADQIHDLVTHNRSLHQKK
jgi:mono/diheme cytochrome c family protein